LVSVQGLSLTFGLARSQSVSALRDVSLTVETGSFFCLLGPSGSGKTTLLRCIAGLERPDAGRIAIGGADVFDAGAGLNLSPRERRIGLVFQSYAVWPHMTVAQNVSFPLRVRRGPRLSREDIRRMVEGALTTVGLGGYGARMATQLSGGQQQRVALARAIVGRPALLLLDEPLSNLDARLRERMRVELRQLHQGLGLTTLYVTHDQQDALFLADRIAVMRDGVVVQTGTCGEVYRSPADRFVADFVGAANFIEGTLEAMGEAGGVRAGTAGTEAAGTARADAAGTARADAAGADGRLADSSGRRGAEADGSEPRGAGSDGLGGSGEGRLGTVRTAMGAVRARLVRPPGPDGRVTVCVRPEDVVLARQPVEGQENRTGGVVVRQMFLGDTVEYWVLPHGCEEPLRVRTNPRESWHTGDEVVLGWPADRGVAL
jgi:iron(III) transport system ATP-binding protein